MAKLGWLCEIFVVILGKVSAVCASIAQPVGNFFKRICDAFYLRADSACQQILFFKGIRLQVKQHRLIIVQNDQFVALIADCPTVQPVI